MNLVKSKIVSWVAISIATGVLLSIVISHLLLRSIDLQSDSAKINHIIYGDDYKLDLSTEEKSWLSSNTIIRLGISRSFPPFGSITEDNKYVGFSADNMRLIEYRTGIKFDIFKNVSWNNTIEMAKAGEIDMISAVVNTKNRQLFLDFTKPYVKNLTSIFNNLDKDGVINSLNDLDGKKVAFEAESYPSKEIRSKYPNIKLIPFKSTATALKQVSIGEADAFVGNQATANYIIQKFGYHNLSVSGKTEFSSTHSIGIAKPNKILKSIMNKVLLSISEEDKAALEHYWFGLDSSLFVSKKIAHIAGIILSSFLIFFAFWSISLRKAKNELRKSKNILKAQSEVDHLTRLGNRTKFYQQLAKEISSKKPFALLFLDLDMFKEVNESFGHNIGDLLLIEVSRRIRISVGELGFVSRIGSDEFMIILHDLSGEKAIKHSVDFIRNRLGETFFIKGIKIKITTSVGITQYPKDGVEAEQLVKNVDQSMFYSKKRGRNCYSYFNKRMQKEAQLKNNLIRDLRIAAHEKQFMLYYQPIVDLTTNTITKAESLIRWNHPERGFISPAEFIPLAEEIGLITEIGDWVFRSAVDYTLSIHNRFDENFQMSVNTSPLQYYKNGMDVSSWLEYLKCTGVSGESIIVEITEGVLMKTTQSVADNLFKLRDLSIRVAIDDFGTGYSSLSYLKKLDVDFLKIDQSFVNNLTSESDEYVLIEAITIMAHKLGIKVIAEGVESELQRDLLTNIGCDFGQGFYFSKPLKSDEFIGLLQNWEEISFHRNSQKELQF